MRCLAILQRHYDPSSELYYLLLVHSILVTRRARKIARDYIERHPEAPIDLEFLTEAALLHDIGVKECRADKIPSPGKEPYIRHGVLGRAILEAEGLPRHALVCERHVGAGLTRDEVVRLDLPLPARDYLPISLEEKIICVADKFFSKSPSKLWRRRKPRQVEESLAKHGPIVLERWRALRDEILER